MNLPSLLQDTQERSRQKIKWPVYYCCTSPNRPNNLGLAIFIRNEMRHCVLYDNEYSIDGIGTQGLTVAVENQEWWMYSVYVHVDRLLNDCNGISYKRFFLFRFEMFDSLGL